MAARVLPWFVVSEALGGDTTERDLLRNCTLLKNYNCDKVHQTHNKTNTYIVKIRNSKEA